MDTDANQRVVTEPDPEKRKALVVDTWQQKRDRMKQACTVCHTSSYVDSFYKGYDDFVVLYNEKFAKPGRMIMTELYQLRSDCLRSYSRTQYANLHRNSS